MLRLAPAAALAWLTAVFATQFPSVALPVTIVTGLGVVLIALRRRPLGAAWLALLFVASTAAHVAMTAPERETAGRLLDGATVVADVTLTSKVEPAWPGTWRFRGDARGEVRVSGGMESVFTARVTVLFTGERPVGVDLGASVRVSGVGEPPKFPDGTVATVRSREPPRVLSAPSGILQWASDARAGLRHVAGALPGTGAELLPGLAVGDTTDVSDELDSAMKVSNLSHLTAVSGSNCAVVVGIVFALAAWCRVPRSGRVVGALLALAGFVVLVTPEASVIRSATMTSIAMIAVLLGRARAGVAVLALAVCLLMVIDPWLSMSVGFLLSVAATAALLLLAGPISTRMERFLPRTLALALAVPIAAQIVCAPLLVLLSPTVSLVGVAANLVAAPAATFGTVAGLLACLLSALPGVNVVLTAVAWVPSQWVATTAMVFAGMPLAQLPWWAGAGGVVSLGIVASAVAVLLVGTRRRGVRTSAVLILALVVGGAAGLWGLRAVIVPATTPTAWSVAACDVGQGDALLIRSAAAVAMIDTGREASRVNACLERLGISHLAIVVLTHFDADHAGGVDAVRGRVDLVVHGPPGSEAHRQALTRLSHAGAMLARAAIGDELPLGDATLRVLWPPPAAAPGNDASVVIEADGGGVPRLIALGDLSAEGQRALLRAGTVRPPYAVVKVAHHGSADQDTALYRKLAGAVALVSVGVENTYGHPRAETLALLTAMGDEVLRTDRCGLLLVLSADGNLSVWHERSPPRGEIPTAQTCG